MLHVKHMKLIIYVCNVGSCNINFITSCQSYKYVLPCDLHIVGELTCLHASDTCQPSSALSAYGTAAFIWHWGTSRLRCLKKYVSLLLCRRVACPHTANKSLPSESWCLAESDPIYNARCSFYREVVNDKH
jgi:hypothetical protein